MNRYIQKNKKTRLVKVLLCFLFVLCPMILSMSVAQAAKELIKFDNTYVDIENQRVWGEGQGSKDAPNARANISIERTNIDYNNHTIDWKITFKGNSMAILAQYKIGLFLPSMDYNNPAIPKARYEAGKGREDQSPQNIYLQSSAPGSKTVEGQPNDPLSRIIVSRERSGSPYEKNSDRYVSINKFRSGEDWREGALHGEKLFGDHYWNHVQEMLETEKYASQSGSDMNTWMGLDMFGSYIASFEYRANSPIIWKVRTYHSESTVLEDVPMIAFTSNRHSGGYKRFAAVGPFGIAFWHKTKNPELVYVDDIDHLTDFDKQHINDAVEKRTQEWLNSLTENDNPTRARKEEEESTTTIDEEKQQYVKTFKDGSKKRIPLSRFVRQRELSILDKDKQYTEKNPKIVVNWRDSVEIEIGVNDPAFEQPMIVLPAPEEDKLPAGLSWDRDAKTEGVPNGKGKIIGIPNIDWSKIEGTPGSKQVTFNFNIALRKEDGTINKRPETYKPISIVVKQDEGAVPVGVEDFQMTPFVILSLVSMSAIAIFFWSAYIQQGG